MEDTKKRKNEEEHSPSITSTTSLQDSRTSFSSFHDSVKRKMKSESREGDGSDPSASSSGNEYLRSLLQPLNKSQLVDFLLRLGSQYPAIAEEIKSIASADPVHRKLFVRGLAWNTTSETLCAAFQEHGEIEEGAVITDKSTGKSRGYGFITYKHMESAKGALAAPSKLIDGRMAVCNLACEGLSATSGTPDLAQRKLYIGGLSPEVTSEMLLDFFSRHGVIEEGSVAYDKDTNESRGFGFVTYKTGESARNAVDDPHKMLGGRAIMVKFADSHKGKSLHGQLPASTGSLSLPMVSSYQQPGKPHSGGISVGYTYPMGPYPVSSFPPAKHYQSQTPMPYPPVTAPKDSYGPATAPPVGLGAYPYYLPKQ